MNAVEKNSLKKEAQLQIKALKKIDLWRTIAIAISTFGVAITYAGCAGRFPHLFLGILGIIMILFGVAGAVVFNLGLKNGRRNVEKMLNILGEGEVS